MTQRDPSDVIATGIDGLDEILHGGLFRNGLYLVEGDPGSGKTTLALQFLLAGVSRGERCMFVTLSEDEAELRTSAESHGWALEGIHILELLASEESLKQDSRYTMYHPSEVELGETTKAVLAEAARIKPNRLVVDSLSEFRLLAENPLRYRRQILALKRFLSRQQSTVLLTDDLIGQTRDRQLHSVAHGVITLGRQTPEYGSIRRRLQIDKMRGRTFAEGSHDFVIRRGGLQVFPRLVAAEHREEAHRPETIKSGVDRLDALLGGGLSKGTSTLIIGAAGTGKSSLATQFAQAAAARGEHATMYLFDESIATFLERSEGFGMDVSSMIDAGRMNVRQIDPAELTPGEFACLLRAAVERDQSAIVVIDSLNGFLNATPSERYLTLHLHEALAYLGQRGVTTLLLMTQHGMVGAGDVPVDASYLADGVILLRYFEAFGEVRQAISVIKKRTGRHERTIREMRLDRGIALGEPIRDFQGVLTGSPQFVGKGRGASSEKDEPGAGD